MTRYTYDRTGDILTVDYAGEQTETHTYNEIGLPPPPSERPRKPQHPSSPVRQKAKPEERGMVPQNLQAGCWSRNYWYAYPEAEVAFEFKGRQFNIFGVKVRKFVNLLPLL